jgi:hypothetical protein
LSASFLDVLEPVEMENLLKVECLFFSLFFNKTNLLRQIRLILHIYHPWFFKTLTKKQQFNFFKTIITKTYEIGSYHYIKKLFSLTHDLEGRLIVDNLTFSFELTNTQNNFNNWVLLASKTLLFSSRENNFKPSVSWVLMVGFFLSYASWRFFFANNTRFVTPFSTFNPNIVTVSLALQSNTEISKLPFAAMTTYTSKTKNKQENTNARQTNYLIPSNSSCVQSSASSQVFKSSLAGSKNTSALTPGQPPLLFKTSDFAKSPMRSNLVQNQSGSALKATLTASAIDDPTRPRTVVVSLGITLDQYRSATMQNQLDKQSQLGVSVPTKNQLYLILGYDPAKATWSHVLLPCTLQVNPNKPEESVL